MSLINSLFLHCPLAVRLNLKKGCQKTIANQQFLHNWTIVQWQCNVQKRRHVTIALAWPLVSVVLVYTCVRCCVMSSGLVTITYSEVMNVTNRLITIWQLYTLSPVCLVIFTHINYKHGIMTRSKIDDFVKYCNTKPSRALQSWAAWVPTPSNI